MGSPLRLKVIRMSHILSVVPCCKSPTVHVLTTLPSFNKASLCARLLIPAQIPPVNRLVFAIITMTHM